MCIFTGCFNRIASQIITGQIAFASLTLFTAGCATTPKYNMLTTQQSLSEAMKQSDDAQQKIESDLQEKKLLLDNLKRSKNTAFRSKEPELRAQLAKMQSHIGALNACRKQMHAANSEIVSLSYNRTEVTSGTPEYNQVHESIAEFQNASKSIHAAIEKYTADSHAFSDAIERNKLFQKFEPQDFVKRIQRSVISAQVMSATMQQELDHAEKSMANKRNDSNHKAFESLTTDMHGLAASYTSRAQRYQGIANEIRDITADVRITSLDPEWPKVQKLTSEFEKTDSELNQISGKFSTQVEKLRSLASENSGD